MHLSFTQLMTYIRCPEHYLFRYSLGMQRLPRKVLKHGFALHETFAYHFDQKKKDGKGIDVYFRELNPKIKPDLVEAAFSIPIQKGLELIGKIDLTDTKDVIHEM